MENSAPAPVNVGGGKREPSIDPVRAQGILREVSRKNKHAAKLWQEKWGFYSRMREMREEEALKIGMSLEEYRAGIRELSCKVEPKTYPVVVDPSPKPIPVTSSAMIGRRAQCPLERYGRLVQTSRDYSTRPALAHGEIYDPYKQTMVFLGSVEGDPISYNLPQYRCEVTDEMWAQPQQLEVSPLSQENLLKVFNAGERKRGRH